LKEKPDNESVVKKTNYTKLPIQRLSLIEQVLPDKTGIVLMKHEISLYLVREYKGTQAEVKVRNTHLWNGNINDFVKSANSSFS